MSAQIIIDQNAGQITIGGVPVSTGSSGIASVSIASAFTATATETYITSMTLPASTLVAGNTFRISGIMNVATGGSTGDDINIRIGTAGTTADTAVCTITNNTSNYYTTTVGFEFLVTFQAVGSSGSVVAGFAGFDQSYSLGNDVWGSTATPKYTTTASINTTSTLKLGVSAKLAGSNTFAIQILTIEQV